MIISIALSTPRDGSLEASILFCIYVWGLQSDGVPARLEKLVSNRRAELKVVRFDSKKTADRSGGQRKVPRALGSLWVKVEEHNRARWRRRAPPKARTEGIIGYIY